MLFPVLKDSIQASRPTDLEGTSERHAPCAANQGVFQLLLRWSLAAAASLHRTQLDRVVSLQTTVTRCGGSQLLTGEASTIEGVWQWGGSFAAAALCLPQISILVTMRDSYGIAAARRVGNGFAAFLSAFNVVPEYDLGGFALHYGRLGKHGVAPGIRHLNSLSCAQEQHPAFKADLSRGDVRASFDVCRESGSLAAAASMRLS
ncbi:hypothetical protein Efla_007490 [Eimeria flavescens]